jgi:predicted O-methyltransferase YrrM
VTTTTIALVLALPLAIAAAVVVSVAARKLRRRLARLDERLDAVHDTMTAATRLASARDDNTAAIARQMSRAVTARVDALAEWIARGATPEAKTVLAGELEEREFFAETLAEGRIRIVQLGQLFPGIESQAVPLGVIDPDTRHANQVDMLYVCAIARHRRARRIFEFGTYLGRTTYHLALGAKAREVFTLDLDPAADHRALKIGQAVKAVHERGLQGHFFKDTPVAAKITQLHGDSRTFDCTPYAGSMDLVFVDGDHTYDAVVNDTERAMQMLRRGGVVIWHDFAPKGRGIVRFAREFARRRPLFWIEDTSLLIYVDRVDAMSFDAPVPVWSRSLLKPT